MQPRRRAAGPISVRTFLAAAGISVAVHAVAMAVVPTHTTPPIVHAKVPVVEAPAPRDPEPIEVAFLEEGSGGGGGTGVGAGRAAHPISTGHTGGAPSEQPAPTAQHSPLMKMRGRELTMTGDFLGHFLDKPYVAPPSVAGAREKQDLAAIDSVLHDAEHVDGLSPETVGALREAREAKRQEIAAVELHPSGNGTLSTHRREDEMYTMKVARDGTVSFKDEPETKVWITPIGIFGRFDEVGSYMRNHGQDPYSHAKQRLLDRTFEQRAEIGRVYHKELLSHSAQLMIQNLARLWTTVKDPLERKRTLFQLWDECTDTGPDAEQADNARAQVLAFIAAKQVVYTEAELVALNAKRSSKAAFSPPSP